MLDCKCFKNEEFNEGVEEQDQVEEDDLAGADQQPTVRRGARERVQRIPPNVSSTAGQTYETAFNQAGKPGSNVQVTEYSVTEAHVIAMIMCRFNESMDVKQTIFHGNEHVITYSLKKALEKFGQPARALAEKEMQQMLNRKCFKAIHKTELNKL